MNFARVQAIADAVLYEGYVLYPYRASSGKNRSRFTFGTLCPKGQGDDPWQLRCECLLEASPDASLEAKVRFLHLLRRTIGEHIEMDGAEPSFQSVESLEVGGRRLQAWDEATPREVDAGPVRVSDLAAHPCIRRFSFEARSEVETVRDPNGSVIAVVRREQQALEGEVELTAIPLQHDIYRVLVSVRNLTQLPTGVEAGPAAAELRSFGSAHAVLGTAGGAFVSLLDPPEPLRLLAEGCQNAGVWPILAGEPGTRDLVLCSPIILYDHPAVAPESPGDLFDATEMDEMLTLRILTLTAQERHEAASVDERVRALLERTERLLPEQLAKLHGVTRGLRRVDHLDRELRVPRTVCAQGIDVGPGDQVRLRPQGRSDVFDIALSGMLATIVSIEQDYESRTFVTVTIDDDPGQDLGVLGKPGHRFFFRPDELEPQPPPQSHPEERG